MENIELQNKYYDALVENYSLHCENGGDYSSFKAMINLNCFQKTDNLIIDEVIISWCTFECISKFWTEKLISDLLLIVSIEDLVLNNFDLEGKNNIKFTYYYFESIYDFLDVREKFLTLFKDK